MFVGALKGIAPILVFVLVASSLANAKGGNADRFKTVIFLYMLSTLIAPFGIPGDIAMQMVGIGFIISVIQDSVETALNSSGDAIFTATAEFYSWKKEGRELPL